MSKKIQQFRGLEKDLPVLEEGRIAFVTDTRKPFIGSNAGNIELAKKSDINERGVSVKDFGAKGDGVTDDTVAIQRAFNECDELYFPDGIYKVTNTLTYDGRKTGNIYRYVGRSVTFSHKAKIVLHANVKGIILRGSGSVFRNMYIEIFPNLGNYNSTVLTLEALDNHTNACESNVFENLKIIQVWGVKKGTAIEMVATGVSYIYKNKFTNLEVNHFYYGVKATTSGSLGVNSNLFDGSIWASQQSLNLDGASGNIFNLTIQNTTLDPENPDLANVYVNGEYNQFLGLIYDVGFNQLVKYAYEFGENGSNNSVGIHYPIDMFKNPHGKFNYLQELTSTLQEQFVLENNPSAPFTDYRNTGGEPLPMKNFRMISALDNSLGRVETIESIVVTANNIGFGGLNPLTNPDSLRRLFNPNKLRSGDNENLLFDAFDRTKESSFEIKLNLAQTSSEFFIAKSIGFSLGSGGAILGTGNVGQVTAKIITKGGKELVYSRVGGDRRNTYHTNNQILFTQNEEPAYHWNDQTRTIVLTFTFPPNSFTRNGNIAYLYSNIVTNFGNSGSFAYIGGDKFNGDIEFDNGAGVVLKTPSGGDYRLGVKDDGKIVWKNKANSSIIEPSYGGGSDIVKNVESQLPALAEGVFGFATDTKKPFIGSGTGNIELAKKSDINERGVSVKDLGVKGDGTTDDTLAIQSVLDNYDNIYFPEGLYRITQTIEFNGEGYYHDVNSNAYRYLNKQIRFSSNSRIVVDANVDGFKLKGSGSHIQNMCIDVGRVGEDYTASAFVMESIGGYNDSCEANIIDGLKLCQGFFIREGTAIKLVTSGETYMYRNKIINIEISYFRNGIVFDNNTEYGINSNKLSGSILSAYQAMSVEGGGNIFEFNIQNAPIDLENPELPCVYVNGDHNQFIGLIYDVGGEELVKYAYEFGVYGKWNSIGCYYEKELILNPYNNRNFLTEANYSNPEDEQFTLETLPNLKAFEDYRYNDNPIIPSKSIKMISGLNNSLGRKDIIERIETINTNMKLSGINLDASPNELIKLFNPNRMYSTWNDHLHVDATDRTLPSRLEIKITFKDLDFDMFMIKSFGVIFGVNADVFTTGSVVNFSVRGVTENGDIVDFERFGVAPKSNQYNNQLLFTTEGDSGYYENSLRSISFIIEAPANAFTRASPISYMYANAVNLYGSSSSFAYIGGDKFGGDIEFDDGAGVVLKSPDGTSFRLTVGDDGVVTASQV